MREIVSIESDSRPLKALLALSFWILGFNALVFQVVFAKKLIFLFGMTAPAIGTVLAVYFSGMALGSFFLGRSADRIKPVTINKFYVCFFLLTGLYGFLFPLIFKLLNWLILLVNQVHHLDFSGFNFFAFLFCAIFLILPAVFLGGGLAVVSKIYIHKEEALSRNVSLLYCINTFGGMSGAALTGFWLAPSFGLNASLFFASGLSLMTALFLYLRFKREGLFDSDRPEMAAEPLNSAAKSKSAVIKNKSFLYALFITGFLALALEVFYTKTLILFIGSSTYAFSMILIIFLMGIALGSIAVSLSVDRFRVNYAHFGMLAGALGLWLLLTILIFERLPFWYMEVFTAFGSADFSVVLFAQFLLTAFLVLPPALLTGITLPIGIKLAAPDISRLGEGIGKLYFSNTLGGVLGSFSAGFIFMRTIGYQKTLVIITVSYFILGSFFILRDKGLRPLSKTILVMFLISFGLSSFLLPAWSVSNLTLGVFDNTHHFAEYSEEALKESTKDDEILFYDEGLSNICVIKKGGGAGLRLRINGKVDASTRLDDLETQILIGALPMALHPDPEYVLSIGLGAGVSLGAITRFAEAKEIDAVEIDPAIIRAADLFKDYNNAALDDPRVNLILADARNHLYLTDKRYDVISAEPSNIWVSGNANLFTGEFFDLMSSRLKDDGIVLLWLHSYALETEDIKTLLKTFQKSFPQTYLFDGINVGNLFMVGSRQEQSILDFDIVNEKFNSKNVRDELRRIYIKSPYQLLSNLLLDSDQVREFIRDGELHTDDRTFLEYSVAKNLAKGISVQAYEQFASMQETIMPAEVITGGEAKELEKYFTFSKKLMRFKVEYIRMNLTKTIESYLDARSMGLTHEIAEQMILDDCRIAFQNADRERDANNKKIIAELCDRVFVKKPAE